MSPMNIERLREFTTEYKEGVYKDDHVTAIQKACMGYEIVAGTEGVFNNFMLAYKQGSKVSIMFNALAQDLIDHITTDKVVDFKKYYYINETNIPSQKLKIKLSEDFTHIVNYKDEFSRLINKCGLDHVMDIIEVLSNIKKH